MQTSINAKRFKDPGYMKQVGHVATSKKKKNTKLSFHSVN